MSNFLWLEGFEGKSSNPSHHGEIDIVSAEFGYSKDYSHPGMIRQSGKVIMDINVIKKSDEDTNKLIEAAVTGKIFNNGSITLERKDGVVTVRMTDISITSFSSDKAVETLG